MQLQIDRTKAGARLTRVSANAPGSTLNLKAVIIVESAEWARHDLSFKYIVEAYSIWDAQSENADLLYKPLF